MLPPIFVTQAPEEPLIESSLTKAIFLATKVD